MREVWVAEDTKLERRVALKFLASHLVSSSEIHKRFQREAKAAAGLSYSSICTVHEIDEVGGKPFIVAEYIEGESLEEQIERGPLNLNDALGSGRRIAEGLQATHEKGVVHRDIRPGNILVTRAGQIKILDFGLALLTEGSKLTKLGTTAGTVAYMSLAQAQGADVDHRTDIWALGCVIYEMVAGVRPFKGQYDQALLYEVVNETPPPLTSIRANVPLELEFVLGKCLAKGASERYQSVKEIVIDLSNQAARLKKDPCSAVRTVNEAADRSPTAMVGQVSNSTEMELRDAIAAPKKKLRVLEIVAAGCVLVAVTPCVLYLNRTPHEHPVLKTSILPPEGTSFFGLLGPAALSPDGSRIAFVAIRENQPKLWIRDLDSLTARAVSGSEGVRIPFWSPDSRSVGFLAGIDLKRVDAAARPVRTIAEGVVSNAIVRGASWSREDVILFSPFASSPLFAVPATGGPVKEATTLDRTNGEHSHPWPWFLPDGVHYLYMSENANRGTGGIYWAELGSNRRHRVSSAVSNTAYAAGHLLYMTEQVLMAQTFNPLAEKTSGDHYCPNVTNEKSIKSFHFS